MFSITNQFDGMASLAFISWWLLCTLQCLLLASITSRSVVTTAFQVQLRYRNGWRKPGLFGVIRPAEVDFDFNVGQGGVQLAQESVIKLQGKVPIAGGGRGSKSSPKLEPAIDDLIRYTRIVNVDQALVSTALAQSGAQIVATGSGNELYQDPGTSTEQIILYAPTEAVKSLLQSLDRAWLSNVGKTNLVINVCGGDDAQVLEVLSALTLLVQSILDDDNAAQTVSSVQFHSISHETFALGSSSVSLVAVPDQSSSVASEDNETSDSNLNSEQASIVRAIAGGEVYVDQGRYFALSNLDVNPAIA
jgi:hypothetical protein